MTAATAAPTLPTHKDLPVTDGSVPTSYHESPQTATLTGCFTPVLRRRYPDGRYSIGMDSFIYWRLTNPPTRGAKAPDWFLVVGVEPMLDGEIRRSYVLWHELISPLLVIEYVSGDGSEERDRTELEGKFWVYENGIKASYYAIVDGFRGTLEMHKRNGGGFHAVPPNEQGRLPIPELGVELGLWRGTVQGTTAWYVRPWDSESGVMLPSWEEAAEAACVRADEAERAADDMRRELSDEAEQTRAARRAEEDARRQADEATRQAEAERRAAEEARRAEEEARRASEQARRDEEEARRFGEESRKQADEARQKAERLAERLRQLGVDPEAA